MKITMLTDVAADHALIVNTGIPITLKQNMVYVMADNIAQSLLDADLATLDYVDSTMADGHDEEEVV